MAGYYRQFSATLQWSLYVWCDSFQAAFMMLKFVLLSSPLLLAPDFMKQFFLLVDASGLVAESVLIQSDTQEVEHLICHFSHTFDSH